MGRGKILKNDFVTCECLLLKHSILMTNSLDNVGILQAGVVTVCCGQRQQHSWITNIYLSDHLFKYGWNFAGEGGDSLLWPEATTILNPMVAYSWPETDIVVYGMRPHGLICHKSRLPPGQIVTTITVISTC